MTARPATSSLPAAGSLFVLCRSCWGNGRLWSAIGAITCCTCGGRGALEIPPIPNLPLPGDVASLTPGRPAPAARRDAPAGAFSGAAP